MRSDMIEYFENVRDGKQSADAADIASEALVVINELVTGSAKMAEEALVTINGLLEKIKENDTRRKPSSWDEVKSGQSKTFGPG